jgi:hypothetical protein
MILRVTYQDTNKGKKDGAEGWGEANQHSQKPWIILDFGFSG